MDEQAPAQRQCFHGGIDVQAELREQEQEQAREQRLSQLRRVECTIETQNR